MIKKMEKLTFADMKGAPALATLKKINDLIKSINALSVINHTLREDMDEIKEKFEYQEQLEIEQGEQH
ncbi:MAG: hypothetical protein ACXQTL_05515 [Methanosarcinales archaeon]